VSPNDLGLTFLDPGQPSARVLPALMVTVLFGLLGYLTHGVTRSGALAGTAVAFLIYVGLGLSGFVTLFSVFAITWLTTRVGYTRKRQLGVAEDNRGRNAGQVLANVGAAAGFAVLAMKFGPAFAIAAVACLAEAAADTASSEIGEAVAGKAWLISNFRRVEPGTNGAISLPGTAAGVAASVIVAAVAWFLGAAQPVWVVATAGVAGTMVDSALGATLERRGAIGNNGVNLLSTIGAGVAALVISLVRDCA
jgi:uncharacterized protein (TIGR00297 family)